MKKEISTLKKLSLVCQQDLPIQVNFHDFQFSRDHLFIYLQTASKNAVFQVLTMKNSGETLPLSLSRMALVLGRKKAAR